MKRLELESLAADRESVKALLASLDIDDPIGRLSFGARLKSIEEKIQRLSDTRETTGSVALMFAGRPVMGSRSIATDFATSMLKSFQDLVTKQIAGEDFGILGSRGRLPEGTPSTLGIRELMRGSVGFVLEENSSNEEITDTPVKKAIDDVTELIFQAADISDAVFEASVEKLNARMLVSLRDFFRTLDESEASIRIVEDEKDSSLDKIAIHRARIRVDATDVKDTESDTVVGELLGLLPESRKFEMKLVTSGEVIRGTVSAALSSKWMELIELPDEKLVGQVWRTKMRIREVRERNRPQRNLYMLLGLLERRDG